MIEFTNNLEVTKTEDIFDEINKRYVAAMMIHGQMADYFNFLGLKGYKNTSFLQKAWRDVKYAGIL